jgi:hypothetical protein
LGGIEAEGHWILPRRAVIAYNVHKALNFASNCATEKVANSWFRSEKPCAQI